MHPALRQVEDLVRDGATEQGLSALLAFISGQLGAGKSAQNRLHEFKAEGIGYAAELNSLARRRRQGFDDPDRIDRAERRLVSAVLALSFEVDRLVAAGGFRAPAVEPAMDADLAAAIPEKIFGRGNLLGVSWLRQGLVAGRAVCRVVAPRAIGTGFVIRGGRIITNNHVVRNAEEAGRTKVEFNFERDEGGKLLPTSMYDIDENGFMTLPEPEDCSVLQVRSGIDDLSRWGFLELEVSSVPSVGDPVTIIQHPNGGEKQIALTSNEVVAIGKGKLAYLTDTLAGSSGSPVFNDAWRVVALHRAGGAFFRTSDGSRVRANEGVLFSHLAGRLDL